MTPTPDTTTQDNNSSVVMTSPPSAMPVPSAEERAATADGGKGGEGIAIAENPYLAGLAKKTRGLKKKLEKIRKTESLSKSGKVRLTRRQVHPLRYLLATQSCHIILFAVLYVAFELVMTEGAVPCQWFLGLYPKCHQLHTLLYFSC